jgi:hypothetical protein
MTGTTPQCQQGEKDTSPVCIEHAVGDSRNLDAYRYAAARSTADGCCRTKIGNDLIYDSW